MVFANIYFIDIQDFKEHIIIYKRVTRIQDLKFGPLRRKQDTLDIRDHKFCFATGHYTHPQSLVQGFFLQYINMASPDTTQQIECSTSNLRWIYIHTFHSTKQISLGTGFTAIRFFYKKIQQENLKHAFHEMTQPQKHKLEALRSLCYSPWSMYIFNKGHSPKLQTVEIRICSLSDPSK